MPCETERAPGRGAVGAFPGTAVRKKAKGCMRGSLAVIVPRRLCKGCWLKGK